MESATLCAIAQWKTMTWLFDWRLSFPKNSRSLHWEFWAKLTLGRFGCLLGTWIASPVKMGVGETKTLKNWGHFDQISQAKLNDAANDLESRNHNGNHILQCSGQGQLFHCSGQPTMHASFGWSRLQAHGSKLPCGVFRKEHLCDGQVADVISQVCFDSKAHHRETNTLDRDLGLEKLLLTTRLTSDERDIFSNILTCFDKIMESCAATELKRPQWKEELQHCYFLFSVFSHSQSVQIIVWDGILTWKLI